MLQGGVKMGLTDKVGINWRRFKKKLEKVLGTEKINFWIE
jgi:hypothetical protein